jgi:ABC-type transport system involved in cytochrome c biogenesis permease subunit
MNLEKKYYSIRIDFGFLYSIALFFSFFVYGGVSDKYWFGIFILSIIYFSANKLDLGINLSLKNLIFTLLAGGMFVMLNNENARNSLIGDHLYHVNIAYAIPLLIIKHKSQFLPEVNASQILWLYSACVVGFTTLMALVFNKRKQFYYIILIFLGLFILLIAFIGGVANNDPHPPLRSYVLSGLGFFGINSTVFRIQGLLPLLILTLWVIEKDGLRWQTVVFLVFVYSIPVLFFNTLKFK